MADPTKWKNVHSVAERYLRVFTQIESHMEACELSEEMEDTRILDRKKKDAENFLRKSWDELDRAADRLIDKTSKAKTFVLLRQIPRCVPALFRSLALGGEDFRVGTALVKEVTRLLWQVLHMADQILELYFQKESERTHDASAGTR